MMEIKKRFPYYTPPRRLRVAFPLIEGLKAVQTTGFTSFYVANNLHGGRKMKITLVHPNCELYGSDRTFLNSVDVVKSTFPEAKLQVNIPGRGELAKYIETKSVCVKVQDMWVLRRQTIIKDLTVNIARKIACLFKAYAQMNASDFIYINTVICFDYIFMARFIRKKVVIHVHEIPNGLERKMFRRLLMWSRADIIYNSHATKAAFNIPQRPSTKNATVYNGFLQTNNVLSKKTKDKKIKILMIGRINAWKGQEVLINALHELPVDDLSKVDVRIVGSTFGGQIDYYTNLVLLIKKFSLEEYVHFGSFEKDPSDSYIKSDIVVVPSIRPEPFGLVAIEAMAYKCAVIASNCGGLSEIVNDNVTGFLISPASPSKIAQAIQCYIKNPELILLHGNNGYSRFKDIFSLEKTNKLLSLTLCGLTKKID